eukprot:COSAG01_NODE_56580_length_317_cov_1.151376_1_plen_43_part_10
MMRLLLSLPVVVASAVEPSHAATDKDPAARAVAPSSPNILYLM